jgi:hypothetical protein
MFFTVYERLSGRSAGFAGLMSNVNARHAGHRPDTEY